MVGLTFLLIFTSLITIPIINTYTILNRIPTTLGIQRFLLNETLLHSTATFDQCVPVQAVKQLECPFIDINHPFYDVFEPVCEKHQLCYACGSVHSLTEDRCLRLSRTHMREICSRNLSSQSACLRHRSAILTLLQNDFYGSSELSFECSAKCVLNYLYAILP